MPEDSEVIRDIWPAYPLIFGGKSRAETHSRRQVDSRVRKRRKTENALWGRRWWREEGWNGERKEREGGRGDASAIIWVTWQILKRLPLFYNHGIITPELFHVIKHIVEHINYFYLIQMLQQKRVEQMSLSAVGQGLVYVQEKQRPCKSNPQILFCLLWSGRGCCSE